MNYSEKTKPGMGDPYWYEWSVGQQYIIDMLNPDNKIKYVELQADVKLGLDDVVVTYEDDEKLFIQVKHTRADDTLTFGDLVSIDSTKDKSECGYSLLGELAKSWSEENRKYQKTRVCLFTNRKVGVREASLRRNTSTIRPALKVFWEDLQIQVKQVENFNEIQFSSYVEAWEEWKKQLSYIEEDEDKLSFLRCLEIETGKKGLDEIEDELLHGLQLVFCTNVTNAKILLGKLDSALRKWTTSSRSTSKISIKDIYQILSLEQNILKYNHDLIPAEPFFESRNSLVFDIENELKYGTSKILFLSGIPGSGKTNIISKLSGKRDSLIDIRYYAYEPIDPNKEYLPMDVSNRVSAVSFWNELFSQLRNSVKENLLKYRVPVINELMTLEEMERKFFEIASAYARDYNQCFIIAIDGIDHAARAGIDSKTFLSTIPDPMYIPDNVKIILAGQPKEDYKNYPSWLFDNVQDIKQLDVPPLSVEDIQSLLNAKLPNLSEIENGQMADLIERYAEGNTLAAIFSVQEALQSLDLSDLEKRLQNRKLSGNIQAYYKEIWDNAIKKIQIPFIDYKMAGVFAFFNEPLNANKLHDIFPSEIINISGWSNVLKSLRPLIIEKSGNYTILHNDVRVYLSGIIGIDQDHVREVYDGLAEYYIRIKDKSRAYYSDILRFLKSAGRSCEFTKVYSTDFIIEAYVNGVTTRELRNISKDILIDIISRDVIDWEQMRILAFGYMTIDQIEKSRYEIENCNFLKEDTPINIQPYECYVENKKFWNKDILGDVLSLIVRLYDRREISRATVLFKRWFSGMTIRDLTEICFILEEVEDLLSPELQTIGDYLGKSICLSKEFSVLHGILELSHRYERFKHHIIDSFISTAFIAFRGQTLVEALGDLECIHIVPFVLGIKGLLEDNCYADIGMLETVLHERLKDNAMGILMLVFMKIVSDNPKWTEGEKQNYLNQVKDIEIPDDQIEYRMTYYSIYCMVVSYLQSISGSETLKEVVDKYIKKHSHGNQKYFTVYFNNICFLGKWLSAKHSGKKLLENPKDLEQLLKALFIRVWHPNERDFETLNLRPYILKTFISLSRDEEPEYKNVVDKICEEVFATHPVNQLLEAGVFYYQNDKKQVIEWFDEWLGQDGKVWNESLGERNRIIHDFIKVDEKYNRGKFYDMHSIIEKAQWSIIGYASHKEYSVDYLLKWYNKLVEIDAKYIEQYAEVIKEISDMIEEVGDNRLEYVLNSKIYADLFGLGYSKIADLMKNNYYLAQCLETPSYFVDGLIGYLKNRKLNEKKLLKIWGIGMALLNWRNESDHATIHSLQRAIEICAENNGVKEISKHLEKNGAAYINLVADPVKYVIPDRWCDYSGDKKGYYSKQLIEEYIHDPNTKIKMSQIKESVEGMKSCNAITDEELIKLFHYEIGKESYSIQHNSLLEYLVEILPTKLTDVVIVEYLNELISRENNYLESDLPELVSWKIYQLGEFYCKNGMEELINLQKGWMTSAGHFQEPELPEVQNYEAYVAWHDISDIGTLFYQIIKILILSDDADAARTALSGLFAMLREDIKYIQYIEKEWDLYHYRAKEWLLMIYELLWDKKTDEKNILLPYIKSHCDDIDFNVALYANIMVENMGQDDFVNYQIKEQSYFLDIPNCGNDRFIKTNKSSQWINGTDYVIEIIELMEMRFKINCIDTEMKTSEYLKRLCDEVKLIHLYRRHIAGQKVVVSNTNLAFFRVIYKEWFEGKWKGCENEIARIILSSTEPYVLLISPHCWKYNSGTLLENVDRFIEKNKQFQKEKIEQVLKQGIKENEMVISGSFVDYTYNQEIHGFMLTYLNIPGMKPEYAACDYERNSRLLFQCRKDFIEDMHYNITLHHNGIESFQQSNIMCGFSKEALMVFNWQINIEDTPVLLDGEGKKIGRLESYYGYRSNIGNRYLSNQPYLQRWIIKKEDFDNAVLRSRIPFSIKQVTDLVIHDYE